MCGRFTLHSSDLLEVARQLHVERVLVTDWQPRYNIAPSQMAPVVLRRDGRTLKALQWGLVPHFTVDPRAARRPINARVESIARLPTFRDAFRQRRCVVPATGYFEWQARPPGRKKQPFWIHPEQDELLCLAGIWESFVSGGGELIETFAIVTTDAAGVVREIHDRMPLTLREAGVDRWLAEGPLPARSLRDLVRAASDVSRLTALEVDPIVSSPANDDPRCIAPRGARPSGRQIGLFD